ncbi:hypothetical protein T01_12922 [Trichinella spiralis]|uniref:Uncharacterized protein n=2 Tax=Trichinella spiralis TaxID=6334 RepID=A0A0V1B3P5_TRISP|nr:hypothetical protein T01_12922 [Trichinella spiralis]
MSATIGESGRIDGSEWVRPQEYHTDAEVWDVMRAMHVQEAVDFDGLKSTLIEASRVHPGSESFSGGNSNAVKASWLFPKVFPGLSGATDRNLLQQFKGGLDTDAVKTAVFLNGTDSFTEAIEVAAQEEGVERELTMLKARESLPRKQTLTRKTITLPLRSRKRQPLRKSGGRGAAVKGSADGQHSCGCKEIAATAATLAREERKQSLLDCGKLLETGPECSWSEDCQSAFDIQLGRHRTLPQSDAVSERRVVVYAIHMLTKTECEYCATQRKMLRVVCIAFVALDWIAYRSITTIIHKKGIVDGIGFSVPKLHLLVADAGGRATISVLD